MSLAFPKPRPRLLDKRTRAADVAKVDRAERATCKARSGGRCEVWTLAPRNAWPYMPRPLFFRCERRATENHHLIGGIGRKNKGQSILAAHRLDVCRECHRELTGHVLVPCVPHEQAERAESVRYERRR